MSGTRHGEERGPFGIDTRRALITAGVAVVLGLGALALLSQATNLGKAIDAFTRADKPWFAGLAAGELVAYAGYTVGYRTVARACGGPILGAWTALRLAVIGFGAYVLAAGAGPLGVDFWALHRAGEGVHAAGRRVIAMNILEWLLLGSATAAAAVANIAGAGHRAPLAVSVGWLTAVPAFVAAALVLSDPRRRLERLPLGEEPADPRWLTRERLEWAWVKVRKGFADAIGAIGFVRVLLAHPFRYAGAFAGFALYWAGDLFALEAAARALGHPLGPTDLLLAYATGYVVAAAPLPAGAAGFAEASTAGALHLVGVPLGTAIFAVFLFRLFTFWLPILPAVAFLSQLRALHRELPHAERERDAPCDVGVEEGEDGRAHLPV